MSHTLVSRSPRLGLRPHLANGHIGFQGTDSGLDGSPSFMIGICDLTPGDYARYAQLPIWNEIRIESATDSLAQSYTRGEVTDYIQQLDMKTGTLETAYRIRLDGIGLKVTVRAWPARHDRYLAVQELTIEPESEIDLRIRVGISGNEEPKRYPFRNLVWSHEDFPQQYGFQETAERMKYMFHPGHMEVQSLETNAEAAWIAATAQAKGNGDQVGMAMAIEASYAKSAVQENEQRLVLHVEMGGEPFVLRQYVAFSRDAAETKLFMQALDRALEARKQGKEALRKSHCDAWSAFWEGDIEIEGDEQLAMQARADLFYLYQSLSVDERFPLPIMGIASAGYWASIFWDCDLYGFPTMSAFRPELARSTAVFRHRTLAEACKRASREGRQGGKFPWNGDMALGEQVGVIREHDDLEIHINADIAIGIWQHYCATSDKIYLRQTAWPVLEAVADFYVSRVTWNQSLGKYELRHVYSAEEGLGIVDNCLFTNASAKHALRIAARAAEILGFSPNPAWKQVEVGLLIPQGAKTGLYEPHSGTAQPSETRFVESCAVYFAELEADDHQLDNILQAAPLFWDMSVLAVIAGQRGNRSKMAEYLRFQASHFIQNEFLVRTEVRGNDTGPFLSGSSSFLLSLLHGTTGMRWQENGLVQVYPPCLPEGVRRISFRGVQWHGRRYDVIVDEVGLSCIPLRKKENDKKKDCLT